MKKTKLKDKFLICFRACAWFFAPVGLLATILVTTNWHLRTTVLETIAHYGGKLLGTDVILIGDSIGAGDGHYAWRRGLQPLVARNLAGNGYQIRQITPQLKKAVELNPQCIVIFAGTNDAFAIQDGFENMQTVEMALEKMYQAMPNDIKILYILPPPTEFPRVNQQLKALHRLIRKKLTGSNIEFVDSWPLLVSEDDCLNPAYTVDGIHLSDAGYSLLNQRIDKALGI